MGIFTFGKKQNNVTQPTNQAPVPVSEAVMDPSRNVWVQDYKVIENGREQIVRYMHNGKEWVRDTSVVQNTPATNVGGKIDLTKNIPNTQAGISLKKSVVSLDKSLVSLKKKTGINFENHRARVAVVMDYSGSMGSLYRNGNVQAVLSRLMPLSLRFDDNGELEVWLFDDGYEQVEPMTLNNFDNYVKNEIMSLRRHMGCTSYAPVLGNVLHKYFKEEKGNPDPVFVIFITDGANDDKNATDEMIRKSAKENIFIQFVGMGSSRFDYLEKLDDLSGRAVDNTGFIKVADFEKLSDEELYNLLLDQYPDWLKAKGYR